MDVFHRIGVEDIYIVLTELRSFWWRRCYPLSSVAKFYLSDIFYINFSIISELIRHNMENS